jgi:hypothetical protein
MSTEEADAILREAYPPLPRRQWYDNAQTLRDRHAHHMRERNLYHAPGGAAKRRAIAERLAGAARVGAHVAPEAAR